MTWVLISRFMMNLRGAYYKPDVGSLHFSGLSNIQFANDNFGSLAAPVWIEEAELRWPDGEDRQVGEVSDELPVEHFPSASDDTRDTATERRRS